MAPEGDQVTTATTAGGVQLALPPHQPRRRRRSRAKAQAATIKAVQPWWFSMKPVEEPPEVDEDGNEVEAAHFDPGWCDRCRFEGADVEWRPKFLCFLCSPCDDMAEQVSAGKT